MMISRKFWSVGTFLPNALLGLIFLHFQEVFGQKIEKMWGCRPIQEILEPQLVGAPPVDRPTQKEEQE